ncbi:MAG: DEAD/DEAH box helicase, partial [Candidatus Woesearchaeota archaeon]
FTGQVSPEKRQENWKKATIIFTTPQGFENDVISAKISLENVSLLGFDEAHKAVGNYSYVWLAKQYRQTSRFERIIALTASPGSTLEKIKEICTNLFIEAIEVRTEDDPDVQPYVQQTDIHWEEVELPESFLQIRSFLDVCIKTKIKELAQKGFMEPSKTKYLTKKDILGFQASLQARLAQGERDYEVMKALSVAAEIMKTHHALELIETQGVEALSKYFAQLQNQARTTKTKATQNLMRDLNFRSAIIKTERLHENNIEHPKLRKLKAIVQQKAQNPSMKMIIFTQYRDSALKITEELNKINNITAKIFVGQLKKKETGMTQKEQKQTLADFREGKFNVLVATQIAEEGLDIPKVDIVIFYEPIPSAIRFIQRKGRTGRLEKGEVIVLTAKNTRDEAYKWSSLHKQKRMYRVLNQLKKDLQLEIQPQPTLQNYIPEKQVTIFADYREKGSGTIKHLMELDVQIKLESLKSADYVCSEHVGVEIKNTEDFVNSLIDGRLLGQLKELKQNFLKPVVLIEGTQDIYAIRNVHPNAIRGLMSTIAVDYSIPVLFSRNPKETAAILRIIAMHEQLDHKKDVYLHGEKKPLSTKELQEYIVSSLPGVGATLAKPLLEKFGSVKAVVNASEDELKEVELIGNKKAKRIKEVTDQPYK